MGITLARRRKIDYIIKNLKFLQKREVNKALDKINPMITDALLEREKGYRTFKETFKLEDVQTMIDMYRERFEAINQIMIKYDLCPLFQCDEEHDPYLLNSCVEYNLWSKERHIDVIKKELDGSTFDAYVPVKYSEWLKAQALEDKSAE